MLITTKSIINYIVVTGSTTVVPILIAVNKTQLIIHYNNKLAWPVYLTISNLNQQV